MPTDGSTEPIGEVEIGDKVKATVPDTEETTDREVVASIVHADEGDITELTVALESCEGPMDALPGRQRHPRRRGGAASAGV